MALYPNAIWRGPLPSSNVGGAMGGITLGVFHIMEGTLTGTDSEFHNPSAQVSAHFGNGLDGTLYQWVDTDQVAYAEAAYNGKAISIEHAGNSGDSLTAEQIATDVALLQWLNAECGIPLAMASGPTGTGWIGHGELGVAGGNHPDCPGNPILAQWPDIVAAAAGPPIPKGTDMAALDVVLIGGLPQVFYVDTNGDVIQVFINNGKWVSFSPTSAANAPKAAV